MCGKAMFHSLEGMSQNNISQHLLTCSPLYTHTPFMLHSNITQWQ